MEIELYAIPVKKVITVARGTQTFNLAGLLPFPVASISIASVHNTPVNPFKLINPETDDPYTKSAASYLNCRFTEAPYTQQFACENDAQVQDLARIVPGNYYIVEGMNTALQFDQPLDFDLKVSLNGFRVLVGEKILLNYKYL